MEISGAFLQGARILHSGESRHDLEGPSVAVSIEKADNTRLTIVIDYNHILELLSPYIFVIAERVLPFCPNTGHFVNYCVLVSQS